jgi:hypothetical protein
MRIIIVIATMFSSLPVSPASLIDRGQRPAVPSPIVVFPNVVPDVYATMDAGRARQQTCMDQYIANAQAQSNGKLSWDEYYSKCDDRLIR